MDSQGLAEKVKNAGLPAAHQIKDCGANRQCPNCNNLIDNSDGSIDWPGLFPGIKFDPSDVELLGHLAAKRGLGGLEPHRFIDEFIPTVEGDQGICYTHPENLPGAKRDGSSVFFFYKTINAYASGRRKRRRIQDQESMTEAHVRWHKTGKTKPVMENGVQKGFKKIMVLYGAVKRGTKPDKCNWTMHQYHLGTDEDEREGEYVVSKIFYKQRKETCKNENSMVIEEPDMRTIQVNPRTPKKNTPDPPSPKKTPIFDGSDDYFLQSLVQEVEYLKEPSHPSPGSNLKDEMEYSTQFAGQPEARDYLKPNNACLTQVESNTSDTNKGNGNGSSGIGDLYNLVLDAPPDFQLNYDLEFASQDSLFAWLD